MMGSSDAANDRMLSTAASRYRTVRTGSETSPERWVGFRRESRGYACSIPGIMRQGRSSHLAESLGRLCWWGGAAHDKYDDGSPAYLLPVAVNGDGIHRHTGK